MGAAVRPEQQQGVDPLIAEFDSLKKAKAPAAPDTGADPLIAEYDSIRAAQRPPATPIVGTPHDEDDVAPQDQAELERNAPRLRRAASGVPAAPIDATRTGAAPETGTNLDILVKHLRGELQPAPAPPTSLAGRTLYAAGSMAAHPAETAAMVATAPFQAAYTLGQFSRQELEKAAAPAAPPAADIVTPGKDVVSKREAAFAAGQLLVPGAASKALPYLETVFGAKMAQAAVDAVNEGKNPGQALLTGWAARTGLHAAADAAIGAVYSPNDPAMGALLGAALGGAHAASEAPSVRIPVRDEPTGPVADVSTQIGKGPKGPLQGTATILRTPPATPGPDYTVESPAGNSAAPMPAAEPDYLKDWDERQMGPKPTREEHELWKKRVIDSFLDVRARDLAASPREVTPPEAAAPAAPPAPAPKSPMNSPEEIAARDVAPGSTPPEPGPRKFPATASAIADLATQRGITADEAGSRLAAAGYDVPEAALAQARASIAPPSTATPAAPIPAVPAPESAPAADPLIKEFQASQPVDRKALDTYASSLRQDGTVNDVRLIGSRANGKATPASDTDVLYDLTDKLTLPADQGDAASAVQRYVEQHPFNFDQPVDHFFQVGDRYFHLATGAGRDIVENSDYGREQAKKSSVSLGEEAPARPKGSVITDAMVKRAAEPATPPEEAEFIRQDAAIEDRASAADVGQAGTAKDYVDKALDAGWRVKRKGAKVSLERGLEQRPLTNPAAADYALVAQRRRADAISQTEEPEPEPSKPEPKTLKNPAPAEQTTEPAPATEAEAPKRNRFADLYEQELRAEVTKNPQDFKYGVDEVPRIVDKMTKSIAEKNANIRGSKALQRVARQLGIKFNMSEMAKAAAEAPATAKQLEAPAKKPVTPQVPPPYAYGLPKFVGAPHAQPEIKRAIAGASEDLNAPHESGLTPARETAIRQEFTPASFSDAELGQMEQELRAKAAAHGDRNEEQQANEASFRADLTEQEIKRRSTEPKKPAPKQLAKPGATAKIIEPDLNPKNRYVPNGVDLEDAANSPSITDVDTPLVKAARIYTAEQGATIDRPNRTTIQTDAADAEMATLSQFRGRGEIGMVIGLPGSGKTSIAAQPLAAHLSAGISDVDNVKSRLPEYERGWGSEVVYQEAGKITKGVRARLQAEHVSYVHPGLGANTDAILKELDALHEKGYQVHLVRVSVSPAKARERAVSRFEDGGHFVRPEYVDYVGTKDAETYDRAKTHPAVASYALIDNDGDTPVIVEQHGAGWLAGSGMDEATGRGGRGQPAVASVAAPAEGAEGVAHAETSAVQRQRGAATPADGDAGAVRHPLVHGSEAAHSTDAAAKASERSPSDLAAGRAALAARISIAGADGARGETFLSTGKRLATKYRVVEAADIQPSHNAETFAPNPEYPEGVQGREYAGKRGEAARSQVMTGALRPEVVLDRGSGTTDGPPVITNHGIVVAGNDRSMRIKRAVAFSPQQYADYRKQLETKAGEFGVDPATIAAMKHPVLVRQIDDASVDANNPTVLGELNRASDTAPTKTKDQGTAAMSRAKAMQGAPAAMAHLAATMDPASTIRDYLGTADGRDFVRELVRDGVIANQELPAFVDRATNAINAEGKQRIEDMLNAAAIGDADVIARTPPAILRKLGSAIPAIVTANRVSGFELARTLQGALDIHAGASAMRAEIGGGKRSVADFLGQGDMFGRAHDAEAARLALYIESHGAADIAKALRTYASAAQAAERATGSHDMFGYSPEKPDAVRRRVFSGETASVARSGDVISEARTTEGRAGMDVNRQGLADTMSANVYQGSLPKIIAKEAIQNAIDAIRPRGKGTVTIHLDAKNRRITVSDDGVGMSPRTATGAFLDAFSSEKPDGASGGLGIAKAALFRYGDPFRMETVAEVPAESDAKFRLVRRGPSTRKVRTTIEGTGQEWIDGRLRVHEEEADAKTPTGTTLSVTIDKAIEDDSSFYEAKRFVEALQSNSRLPNITFDAVHHRAYGDSTIGGTQSKVPARPRLTAQIPGGSADVFTSDHPQDFSFGGYATAHILNNGYHQFDLTVPFGPNPPEVWIDVHPDVPVSDPSYPFTIDRGKLKDAAGLAIRQSFKSLASAAEAAHLDVLIRSLATAPEIHGGGHVYATAGVVTKAMTEQVAGRPYASAMAAWWRDAGRGIVEAVAVRHGLEAPTFDGIGLGGGYLAVNVMRKGLFDRAKELGVDVGSDPSNLLLFNPFNVVLEARAQKAEFANDPEHLADQLWGALVHEIAHQNARGHDEKFAGEFTRIDGRAARVQSAHLPALEDLWRTLLADEHFLADVDSLKAMWQSKADTFQGFIGHANLETQRSAVPGNHLGGADARGDVLAPSRRVERGDSGRTTGPATLRASREGSSVESTGRGTDLRGVDERNGRDDQHGVVPAAPPRPDVEFAAIADPFTAMYQMYKQAQALRRRRMGLPPAAETSVLDPAIKRLTGSAAELRDIFNPAGASDEAGQASRIIRAGRGEMDMDLARARQSIEDVRDALDSLSPGKNFDGPRWDWYRDMEAGRLDQIHGPLQGVAHVFRKLLDDTRDEIQELGPGHLDSVIENYMPRIYGEGPKIKSAAHERGTRMGKRPFQPKNFKKQRAFETLDDAIAAGYKPISDNPIDMLLLKLREMRKYLMAQRIKEEMKATGLVKFTKKLPPDGWSTIDDNAFTVFAPRDAEGAQRIRGRYIAPSEVARIVNNFLSPGLRGRSDLYDSYNWLGNMLNMAQLGMSAFHAGFVAFDATVQTAAIGLDQLMTGAGKGGRLAGAGKLLIAGASAATGPLSVIPLPAAVLSYLRGSKVWHAYLNDSSSAEMQRMLTALTQGGGRAKMDDYYRAGNVEKFRSALRDHRWGSTILHAPFAAIEGSMYPLLEHVVPRMKLGAIEMMMDVELSKLPPGATDDQVRKVAAKVVDAVDARLGQMIYDNRFWHRATKEIMMAGIRSVGWDVGTFDVTLGGAAQAAGNVRRLVAPGAKATEPRWVGPAGGATGHWEYPATEPPEWHKVQYLAALAGVVALYGAIYTYLHTGDSPKGKDFYFPRTGKLDRDGNPERIQPATYVKDIFSIARHPVDAVLHKIHPLLQETAEALQNRDFYGNQIRNPDDPGVVQLRQIVDHIIQSATPLSIRNASELTKRGITDPFAEEKVQGFFGNQAAPREVVKTTAQNKMNEILARRGQPVRTPEEQTARQGRQDVLGDVRSGDVKRDSLRRLVRAGELTPGQAQNMASASRENALVTRFKMLTPEEARTVYDLGTPEEQDLWDKVLKSKERRNRLRRPMAVPPA